MWLLGVPQRHFDCSLQATPRSHKSHKVFSPPPERNRVPSERHNQRRPPSSSVNPLGETPIPRPPSETEPRTPPPRQESKSLAVFWPSAPFRSEANLCIDTPSSARSRWKESRSHPQSNQAHGLPNRKTIPTAGPNQSKSLTVFWPCGRHDDLCPGSILRPSPSPAIGNLDRRLLVTPLWPSMVPAGSYWRPARCVLKPS